jgi:hypothetical protein
MQGVGEVYKMVVLVQEPECKWPDLSGVGNVRMPKKEIHGTRSNLSLLHILMASQPITAVKSSDIGEEHAR